jgi:predicted SAM-dependent methyltransferase
MIKINMGCGWRNFGPQWIHIDGGDYEHLDFKSITNLSQFENNSVDLIYCSHVISYFDRQEIIDVLKEWNRVLKVNGTLRIAVPNFSEMANLYINKNIDLNKFIGPLYGKMKMGDQFIYHKTVYDFNSLKFILESCNFTDCRLYDWRETDHQNFDDHSQAYIPHMDKEKGTLISLNMECTK